jgi:hypothetical protein
MILPVRSRLAIAVLVCTVGSSAAACSSSGPTDMGSTPATFVGYRWDLIEIKSPKVGPSRVPLDPRDPPEINFTSDGQFGASDGINYMTGHFSLTASGYHSDHGGSTFVGTPQESELEEAIIDGMDMLAAQLKPVTVNVSPGAAPNTVIMTADGFVFTFRQAGHVSPLAPPPQTGTP